MDFRPHRKGELINLKKCLYKSFKGYNPVNRAQAAPEIIVNDSGGFGRLLRADPFFKACRLTSEPDAQPDPRCAHQRGFGF